MVAQQEEVTTTHFLRNNSDEEQKQIKIMTYNIRYTYGMDEKYDIQRIAKVIRDHKPDIAGLQEIGDSAMAAKLGELTGMKHVFGPSQESMQKYGDAVLCRFPFEWVDNYSIPSASSSRYQVMGIDVDLSEVYGSGVKIRFLNTHFDWLPSIGSQEARLATVNVIERGFFENKNLPAILTGDLNATPDSPPLKRLEQKGWYNKKGGSELFTIPVVNPKKQIDYVLVRPKESWKIVDVEVIQERVASDHLPVVMILELKQ
jgi:endonuclease/exonuclease/phosphatase family metal-dependent hydrolase